MIYNGRPAYRESEKSNEVRNEFSNLKSRRTSTIIVNVARVQPQKNQLSLAKTIDNMNRQGKCIDLMIIGRYDDSPITPYLNSLNSKYIHLLGEKQNPRDYIKAADAFCLSSVFEGMPITLIECFSVGTIPICTPAGGIKNMIKDGENGILTTGFSQSDMRQAIERFLLLPESDKIIMRKNSQASFVKYTIDTCAKKYEDLMLSI